MNPFPCCGGAGLIWQQQQQQQQNHHQQQQQQQNHHQQQQPPQQAPEEDEEEVAEEEEEEELVDREEEKKNSKKKKKKKKNRGNGQGLGHGNGQGSGQGVVMTVVGCLLPGNSACSNAASAACDPPLNMEENINHSGNLGRGRNDSFGNNANGVANANAVSVCGILNKWVNLGRGWRSRWFVLRDGVLSYYKIHGSQRIYFSGSSQEREKAGRVIGEESSKLMRRLRSQGCDHHPSGRHLQDHPRPRPLGELHLKVSSIRQSRSDERRFSIYTGTKRLHLRADTKEDRAAWIEALTAGKDLFPDMSTGDFMVPVESISISTEKLKSRLLQEGLNETAVNDVEQIIMSEFTTMQNQLRHLQQQNIHLLENLRQLEAEKFDLENKVVDESQHRKSLMFLRNRNGKYSEGSATDSDDENERQDGQDEETDEDENTYFDTKEVLSSSSFNVDSESMQTFMDSHEELVHSNCTDNCERDIEMVGFDYPSVKRRSKLPEPKEIEKGVSLWSIIKDNIGKDLTKVCLPVYFNEPLSSLQKCFEELEYSYLLDRAFEWGRRGNSIMRILNVAAFAVSAYASTEGRHCKPFNPLLGETYEADFPDKGIRFISEKVSHHPMIVACHCEGRGWKFWADSTLKSKFWGRSIQVDPVGTLTLEFDDGEVFTWNKVTTAIYNLILGKIYCDHYGTMTVQSNREYTCKVKFKEQSLIDRNPHQVQAVVQNKDGHIVSTMYGKWDDSLYSLNGDGTSKARGSDQQSEASLLWRRNKPSNNPTRYNLTRFAITMNELTPGLKEKLPPTDSRLRPDQRHLENGEYDMANKEKLRLEQRQRQARSLQERGWKPRWFRKLEGKNTFEFVGGYWESRDQGKWDSCPDIFGQTSPDVSASLY